MAEGQTFSNTSSVQQSLEDYLTSIEYFEKRLTIAKECNDQIGQRRAHANLGNAYLYLEDFDKALYHYREAMIIGEITNDDVSVAQISFIIGCVYHLRQEYKSAIYFHEKHLNLALQCQDSQGQCQAYFILSQLYDKTNQNDKANKYLTLHTTLAREVEQSNEMKSGTKCNLNKNLRAESISISLSESHLTHSTRSHSAIPTSLLHHRSLANTNNKKSKSGFLQHFTKKSSITGRKQSSSADPDELVDLVYRMQKSRFDDQRCEIKKSNTDQSDLHGRRTSTHLDEILNTIDRLQQFRLDDQRTTFPSASTNHNSTTTNQYISSTNETFFDQLAKCQDSRMDDQRAVLLPLSSVSIRPVSASAVMRTSTPTPTNSFFNQSRSKTLPDEEFFAFFNRLQSRYTEQHQIWFSSSQQTRLG